MHKLNIKKTIKNLSKPGENLSQCAVRGGFWVFSLRLIQQSFNLARLIILARILAPHDFGLLGIALLTMATLETFSQTGFQQALIQKKKDIKSYLDSAWTVSIIRGIILFLILYLIAPYAAIFFEVPEAKLIIQVIGLSILLKAFTNIGVIYFQKELEFNKQFIYQLSGTLVDFIVAVSAALMLQNVWALVYGVLAGNLVRFIMSYLVHPYRPHLSLDMEKIKELFGFGKWIMGSSILIFLITQGDDIFVGKLLGVTALGFYQMAYKISNLPATEITHVISQVTFPAYSKLQDNIQKLREAYLKTLQLTAFLSFPIAGLIFVLAPDFTTIFLGEKWMPMVPAMQVLVIAGLLRSIMATTGPIFNSVGKPKIGTKWQIIRLFVLVSLIYIFTIKLGILGTSIAVFLSNFISTIGFCREVITITKCKLKDFIKMIFFPLINGVIIIITVNSLKMMIHDVSILEFISFILVSFLVTFGLVYLFDKLTNYNIGTRFKDIINSLNR